MAKKGNATLRAGLAAARKLGRQMNREAAADYAVVQSAGAAGAIGLRRGLGRIEKAVARDIAQQQAGIAILQNNARVGARATRARENQSVYGAALKASASAQFAPARTTAAGTTKLVNQMAAQGAAIGATGKQVANIARQGAAAQEAAASYAYAQALQQRNIVSAETVAQLTGNLYQAAISSELEFQNWKRQQEYLKKEEEKKDKLSLKGLSKITDTVPGVLYDVARLVRSDDPPQELLTKYGITDPDASPGEIAAAVLSAAGINLQDASGAPSAELQVLQRTIGAMRQNDNVGAQEAFEGAMHYLYSGVPGWDKYHQQYLSSAQSMVKATIAAGYQDYMTAYINPDSHDNNGIQTGVTNNYTDRFGLSAQRV